VSRPAPTQVPLLFTARPELPVVVRVLEHAGLPTLDLTQLHLEHFFYCGPNDAPTGLVGLELYETNALLRSLWVAPASRTAGLGSALVDHVEDYARAQGARVVYLLTTSAEGFFARLGYQRIARGSVACAVQASREFTELCPDSSAVMIKAL
jgi:amino-acid N-acetyltransferase